MRCSVAYTNCRNICSVLCLVVSDEVSDQVMVLWLLHLYENMLPSSSRLPSLVPGVAESDWEEKVCRLYRKVAWILSSQSYRNGRWHSILF